MAKLYPVVLEPLRLNDSGLKQTVSPESKIYAVISNSEILVGEKSPLALGHKYYEKFKKRSGDSGENSGKGLDKKIDVLSYDCPDKVLVTKKGIFGIKNLGSLFIRDFEKGISAEFERHEIKPPSEK